MRRSLGPRTVLLLLTVSVMAIGWSVRPRSLASSDLYGDVPSSHAATADYAGDAENRDSANSSDNRENTDQSWSAPASQATTRLGSDSLSQAQPERAVSVNWDMLRTLNYRNGDMSAQLRALNGKRVRVPGFIVPLDDFQDVVKEFLLVPYFGACVHTPPPPPNQIVLVRMKSGKQKVSLFEPVWIEGVLSIKQYESIYGAVGFQISGERVSPYR